MYCNVAASGHAHTPANVKAAGFSHSVSSPGSFTATVTGVSGEGTKSVACVGEDATGNLGATVSSGPDFSFGTWSQAVGCTVIDSDICHAPTDTTGPTVSSVGGTHSDSTADISGSTDEVGTMYCIVDKCVAVCGVTVHGEVRPPRLLKL